VLCPLEIIVLPTHSEQLPTQRNDQIQAMIYLFIFMHLYSIKRKFHLNEVKIRRRVVKKLTLN